MKTNSFDMSEGEDSTVAAGLGFEFALAKNIVYPLTVSCHGDSTILVGTNGRWATGQIPRDRAEQICKLLNARNDERPITVYIPSQH